MSGEVFIEDYLAHFRTVLEPRDLSARLLEMKDRMESVRAEGKKVILAGNGASATLASHYALDFTKQAGVRSMAFNDSALLTAYSNDYGYEHWVRRALEHHACSGDLAILISSSGRSQNMINAAEYCRDSGVTAVTFTGFEATNPLRELGDINLWADSRAYNVVEAVHGMWLGLLCDLLVGKREYGVKG